MDAIFSGEDNFIPLIPCPFELFFSPSFPDNISTKCYTPDLQNIICQWNGSRYGEDNEYKLYYKTNLRYVFFHHRLVKVLRFLFGTVTACEVLWVIPAKTTTDVQCGCDLKWWYHNLYSEVSGWTDWTECLADRNLTGQCSFRGEESRKVMVKLSNAPAPLSRTFYTQEFTLRNNSEGFFFPAFFFLLDVPFVLF